MDIEIYKNIPDYEGMYQVSNFGRVKSLERLDRRGRIVYGRELSPTINKEYQGVNLSKEGKATYFRVHQLVAMAFLDHIPNGFNMVVNHKNLNKHDNRLDNLEVITMRENGNKKHIPNQHSKYVGVYKHYGRWVSGITVGKTKIYLGCFQDEYEAHLAYQNKLKEITEKE